MKGIKFRGRKDEKDPQRRNSGITEELQNGGKEIEVSSEVILNELLLSHPVAS